MIPSLHKSVGFPQFKIELEDATVRLDFSGTPATRKESPGHPLPRRIDGCRIHEVRSRRGRLIPWTAGFPVSPRHRLGVNRENPAHSELHSLRRFSTMSVGTRCGRGAAGAGRAHDLGSGPSVLSQGLVLERWGGSCDQMIRGSRRLVGKIPGIQGRISSSIRYGGQQVESKSFLQCRVGSSCEGPRPIDPGSFHGLEA